MSNMVVSLQRESEAKPVDFSVPSDAMSSVHNIANLAAGLDKNDRNVHFMVGEGYGLYSFSIQENPDNPTEVEHPIEHLFEQADVIQDPNKKTFIPIDSLKAWEKLGNIVKKNSNLESINMDPSRKKNIKPISVDKCFLEKVKTLMKEEPGGTGAVIGNMSGYHRNKHNKYELYLLNQSSNQEVKIYLDSAQAKEYKDFLGKDGEVVRAFGVKNYNVRKQLTSLKLISMSMQEVLAREDFEEDFEYEKGYALFGYRPKDVTMDDMVQAIKESRGRV